MKPASDVSQLVSHRLRESIAVNQAILDDPLLLETVEAVARLCVRSLGHDGKIILFGNGGSAADAQHLSAELVGRYLRDRQALAGIALTVNSSCLTAIGNDYSFAEVFSRQIEALGTKRDVAIGISTSGTSENVIRALRAARSMGMATVGMTGSGGRLTEEVDYCIRVPSTRTPRIQEAHIVLGHILCELIEEAFTNASNLS
jgi:D-sedoheptulose 7-phosphate isomerase